MQKRIRREGDLGREEKGEFGNNFLLSGSVFENRLTLRLIEADSKNRKIFDEKIWPMR
jgi:hypothetical protein